MENDGVMRRRQQQQQQQQQLYQQQQYRPQKQHRSNHLPQHHASTLESLVQKPKSFHSKPSSMERTKAPESSPATRKPNKGPKQTQPKPKSSKAKNKLKLLNCFANSHQNKHNKYDDPEALRQQALIAREQYSRRNRNNHNALSPTSMATQDVYFDTKSMASRSTAKHRNHQSRRNHNHRNAQHILEDLQEEEHYDSNGSGEDRGGSFINLSISDIEERFERRDAVPLHSGEEQQQVAKHHAEKAYESATKYETLYQNAIPSPQEQNIPGKNAMEQTNSIRPTPPTQAPPTQYQQYQQQLHRQLQIQPQRIPGTNALDFKPSEPPKVEQRHRPEPRQPLTKEKKQQQQQQKQEYYKHRLSGNITPVGTTTPQKAIPWIKPQSSPPTARESEHDTSQSTTEHKENIPSGSLCHFCGGPHWIYSCPHMDESTAASRRRRQRYYEYDDEESDFSSLESYTSRQSNLLQCQPCLKGVTNALKASLQTQSPNQR